MKGRPEEGRVRENEINRRYEREKEGELW
jgi:hypothetical protein